MRIKNIQHIDRFLFIAAIIVLLTAILVKFGTKKIIEIKSIKSLKSNKMVTLVFSQWWEYELQSDTLHLIINEFEKSHPGIKIELKTQSYQDIEDKILNRINDKIAGFTDPEPVPDILGLDPRWLYGLVQNNMLEPLASYMQHSKFVPDLHINSSEKNYGEWAFPLISFMAPLFYNIDILKAAGFDRPPKNRTDFLKYARAITNSSMGQFGTTLSLSQSYPQGIYLDVYSWVWASGAAILHQGKPNFIAPSVYEALDFLNQLYREGLISPEMFSKNREQKLEEFINGNVGMMIASVQDIDLVRERMGNDRFGITAIPGPDTYYGKPALGLTNWYVGISQESEHKEEAWAFISFLAGRVPALVTASHAVPGSGNSLDDYLRGDTFYSKAYDIYEGGDGIQEFVGFPAVHVLDFIVREELYNMFEWGQDTTSTVQAIQRRWEEVFQNALRFGS